MSLYTFLLILLVLVMVGTLPAWNHSRDWGYAPSGVLTLIVVVVIVLALTGRIHL